MKGVLLSKGIDSQGKTIVVEGQLFSMPGERLSYTGVADSIAAVQEADLLRAPTYLVVEGDIANRTDSVNNGSRPAPGLDYTLSEGFVDTNAEELIVVDQKGILGPRGTLYFISTENVALFSNDHPAIRTAACNQKSTPSKLLRLTQDQVDGYLEALIDSNSSETFRQRGWVKSPGSRLYIFKGRDQYNKFLEASNTNGFLTDMPAYVSIRT